jgi:hypothetical protein
MSGATPRAVAPRVDREGRNHCTRSRDTRSCSFTGAAALGAGLLIRANQHVAVGR